MESSDFPIIIFSKKLRRIVCITAVVIFLAHIFAALVMSFGNTGITFHFSDRLALIGIGIILTSIVLCGLRPKLILTQKDLSIRNLGADRTLLWTEIIRFDFEKYWAYAVLAHEERIILLSIPIIDGDEALKHMKILRKTLAEHIPI